MRHHIFIYTAMRFQSCSLLVLAANCVHSRVADMTFQFVFAGMRQENRLLLYIVCAAFIQSLQNRNPQRSLRVTGFVMPKVLGGPKTLLA